MKRKKLVLISALLMTAMLLPTLLLSSCAPANNNTPETTVPAAADTTAAAPADLVLVEGGTPKITIVRPDKTSQPIIDAGVALNDKFERYASPLLPITSDFVMPNKEIDNTQYEILIGETNRDATKALLAELPANSWGIRVTDTKVVIVGTDDNQTACALYAFEDNYMVSKLYNKDKTFKLPVGTYMTITDDDLATQKGILECGGGRVVAAVTGKSVQISPRDGFGTGQGAATDGTYFYNILKKNVNDVETDIVVKTSMADNKFIAQSKELPLDHANDMCYDSKLNRLVIPNMVDKKMSFVNPDTLELIETISADGLPGVPYAIAYNAPTGGYIVLAGGVINFTDANFNVQSTASMQQINYVGQGMDADENFIYIPRSPKLEEGYKDNCIIVHKIDGSFLRFVYLDTTLESESMLNYGGQEYINFNTSGAKISTLEFVIIYK